MCVPHSEHIRINSWGPGNDAVKKVWMRLCGSKTLTAAVTTAHVVRLEVLLGMFVKVGCERFTDYGTKPHSTPGEVFEGFGLLGERR
jgi:hypothetical protein